MSWDQALHTNKIAKDIETDAMYQSEDRWVGSDSWEIVQVVSQSGQCRVINPSLRRVAQDMHTLSD